MSHILTLNNFNFNGRYFLQIRGCAMESTAAPSYATIYMENLEEKYMYPEVNKECFFYTRYNGDNFLYTKEEKQNLPSF